MIISASSVLWLRASLSLSGGNDRITENARQKEVRATMQLVTEELEYNRQELRNIKHLLDIDIHMSLLLREHDMDVSKIPTDTLWKYGKFFNNMDEFSYRTDALDVLKGSSLMQYIPDKRMLQDVLQTYFELGRKQKDVSDYYATKTDALMSAAMSREWANVFDGGDGLRDQALFLVQYKNLSITSTWFPVFCIGMNLMNWMKGWPSRFKY